MEGDREGIVHTVIHVGCTRCVTWSIESHNCMPGQLGVFEFIRAFLFPLFYSMFDSHYQYGPFLLFFQWLRKNLNRWEGNIQRLRELDPIAIRGDDYNPTLEYQRQRASNLIQRCVMKLVVQDKVGSLWASSLYRQCVFDVYCVF